MNNLNKKILFVILSSACLFSGCTKKEKTISGIALGAGTGALLGSAIGGHAGGGIAGAALGGIAGGFIGNSMGDDK